MLSIKDFDDELHYEANMVVAQYSRPRSRRTLQELVEEAVREKLERIAAEGWPKAEGDQP